MTFDPEKTIQMSVWDVLVSEVSYWQNEQFPDNTDDDALLGMIEEAGELCHALLKSRQNIRGFDDKEKTRAAIVDACCDAAIFAINYLNLTQRTIPTWERVKSHKSDAKTLVECAHDLSLAATLLNPAGVIFGAKATLDLLGVDFLRAMQVTIGEVVKRDWGRAK